jgi:ribonuclease R
LIITIDPTTAKDFDDAIHVKVLGPGRWEVGVHIADVAHYVQPGSALDKEARKRGNSVYLVDQVIPMLPEELSNGLCSLIPNVDRLTYSVIVEVNADGQWSRPQVSRSIIHSKRRFAYEEAFEILQRKPKGETELMIHRAWEAASALRQARMKNGSLDLDMPEVKVRLDEQNQPIGIERVEHDISHQLIEELMLLANEIVATQLTRQKINAVYRVHESPDPEKLEAYRELLKIHEIRVGNLENRKEIQKALKKIEGRPEAHALKVGLLRSMKKADYRTKCIGHYGLAKSLYTHFTSPIRRYADLIVHRALADRRSLPSKGQLDQIAAHISETERTASDAEMESVKLKKLQYFQHEADSETPTEFEAIIMDVQNYGIFVELPQALMSGLVHVSTLDDDFYHFQQREMNFKGRKTGHTYSIGDTIKVVVDRIDLFKQQIDFRIVQGKSGNRTGSKKSPPKKSGDKRQHPNQRPRRKNSSRKRNSSPRSKRSKKRS